MESTKINKWFGRYATFLLKWRWAAIALFAVILVLSFIGMSKMVQQTSFDDYFIEGDPMLVKTNEFKANFGNDYFIGILTECEDHFTKENLTVLRELGEELLDSLLTETRSRPWWTSSSCWARKTAWKSSRSSLTRFRRPDLPKWIRSGLWPTASRTWRAS
jgi:Predicted exporters of the RND superfamily